MCWSNQIYLLFMERMLRRIAIRKDWTISMSEFRKLAEKYQWEIDRLEEENRKMKIHIEAKDKAYTALLKDYEEIKEDRDKMKAEIEQRLNAFRNR